VPDAIARLLDKFSVTRSAGENLRQFLARHSNDDLRAILAGSADVVVVARDAAQGSVPLGAEG
jgi:hypothetical protein